MKRFIRWLAKVFNAEITIEKVIEVEKEKVVYKTIDSETPLKGTISVEGDLIVDGNILVTGDVTCRALKVEEQFKQD